MGLSPLFSQSNTFVFPNKEFNSVFQGVSEGNYSGTINGVLFIQNTTGQELILDFQGSNAALNIIPDEHEVYDVSTKSFEGETTSGKTKFAYATYASANRIQVHIGNKVFQAGLFDGASDMVIAGLDYMYKAEKGTEYIILRFEKTVSLTSYWWLRSQTGTSLEELTMVKEDQEEIKILANSVIVFAIKR